MAVGLRQQLAVVRLVVGILGFTIIIGIGIVLVPIWWIVAAYDAYKQVIKRDQRYGYAQSNPYFFVSRPTLRRPSKLTPW